ncbi:MAG: hypothetical protein GVY13_17070 [Alphaproteobacteria bacterium]|jgi:signal transduction histidine kinase|nr:hypothetical protein [Alphaproteobacteria bacterium]
MIKAPAEKGTSSRSYDAFRSGQDSRLIVLALTAIIGILAVVVYLIIAEASRQLDEAGADMANTAISSAVAMRESDIGRLAIDYTWWEVSFEQVTGGLDPDWAEDNLGPWLSEEFGMDVVAVVDGAGRTIYNSLQGEIDDRDVGEVFPASLQRLIDEARASPREEPEPSVAYLRRGGAIDLVAVSPFTHDDPEIAAAGPPVRPVLILADRLDADWLGQLQAITGIAGLSIVESAGHDRVSLALPDPNGAPVGHLNWGPSHQAGSLVAASAPWLVAAFAAAMILSALIASRFSITARELARRNQELQISEAQARDAQHRAEDASRAKSRFLASMSHEVRTPLNAIIGFSDVLRGEERENLREAALQEYATYIHTSGRQLLGLLNDILDLAKVEAGRLDMHEEPVALPGLLTDCVATIRPLAGRRSITVAADCAPDVTQIRIDAFRLKQVVLNLLDNAVKFTPAGGRVSVRAARSRAGLEIAVEDTGIGIAEEDQTRVFEPFTQVHDPLCRDTGGTGLGLALVRELVQALGGTVVLASTPGRGTTVRITLPRSRILTNDSAAPAKTHVEATAALEARNL